MCSSHHFFIFITLNNLAAFLSISKLNILLLLGRSWLAVFPLLPFKSQLGTIKDTYSVYRAAPKKDCFISYFNRGGWCKFADLNNLLDLPTFSNVALCGFAIFGPYLCCDLQT